MLGDGAKSTEANSALDRKVMDPGGRATFATPPTIVSTRGPTWSEIAESIPRSLFKSNSITLWSRELIVGGAITKHTGNVVVCHWDQ
ncbi:hypothetical protein [Phyllobacterium zundukense]|uniref:Uncharacterized protein n=1 Tax=Phyllobacterium zundukense TaxID=1867719 RepID=A0ACD4CXP5_9HYPH|nr:hypothetical protein [Phyllobacterium zundukense]UXN58388.1 hypothetical protein N8E88_10040 [Phyllobacterium zundukense]